MSFTDSHSHIYKEYYNNIDDIVKNAKDVGVSRIISAADNTKSCFEMLELAKKYENIYVCLGIHPQNYQEDIKELDNILKANKNNNKIIAIGEIGLDYYYGKENKEEQIFLFEKQVELAEKYDLPIIVHSREATKDTMDILKKHKVKGVIHCFSGSLETALEYIKLGYMIGIGGVITFKNANLKDIVAKLPLENIILETDSPYLSPEPFRGQTNEPKNIRVIAEFIANLKGISVEEVENTTESNINKLFNI